MACITNEHRLDFRYILYWGDWKSVSLVLYHRASATTIRAHRRTSMTKVWRDGTLHFCCFKTHFWQGKKKRRRESNQFVVTFPGLWQYLLLTQNSQKQWQCLKLQKLNIFLSFWWICKSLFCHGITFFSCINNKYECKCWEQIITSFFVVVFNCMCGHWLYTKQQYVKFIMLKWGGGCWTSHATTTQRQTDWEWNETSPASSKLSPNTLEYIVNLST